MNPDQPILVLDNGANKIKSTFYNNNNNNNKELPIIKSYLNSITKSKNDKRTYISNELEEECLDFSGLNFKLPFERGILTNWDAQKTIWDKLFITSSKFDGLKIDPTNTSILMTEPIFNLPNVQDNYDQIIFEEYEFENYLRCPGPSLVPFGADARGSEKDAPECVLVVDSGFSFTHIAPVFEGSIISSGVRRIDVGGKLLTNHLKELISFRQWYMMDQTFVVEKVKKECCFVSNDWKSDLEIANKSKDNSIVQTYVLPDFVPSSSNKLGYLRIPPTGNTPPPELEEEEEDVAMEIDSVTADRVVMNGKGKGKGKGREAMEEEEQLLQMSNERFSVPEVLFNPSTIGLAQAGIAESIATSINSLPLEVQGMFWSNIVCVGGNTGFSGFHERLGAELRHLAPAEFKVRVIPSTLPTETILNSAHSALSPSLNPLQADILRERFISRIEYQEGGSNAVRRKFGGAYWTDTGLREELGL